MIMASKLKNQYEFVNSKGHRQEIWDRTKFLELYRTDTRFINRLWTLALFEYRKSSKCQWHHISFFNVTRIIIEQYKKWLSVWFDVISESDFRDEQIQEAIDDYERKTWLKRKLAQAWAESLLLWFNVVRGYRKHENDMWRINCVPFGMYCPWYQPCAWEEYHEVNKHQIYTQHTSEDENYLKLLIYEREDTDPDGERQIRTHRSKNTLTYDPDFLIDHRVAREHIDDKYTSTMSTDTLGLYFFNNSHTCHWNKRWYGDSFIKPIMPLIRELMEITSWLWQDLIEQIRFTKMSVPWSTRDGIVEDAKSKDSTYGNSTDKVTLDKDVNLFTHEENEKITQYIQKHTDHIKCAFERREQLLLEISAISNIAPIKFGLIVWWGNEPAGLKSERQEWYSDTVKEHRNTYKNNLIQIYQDMLYQEYGIADAELSINFHNISQDEVSHKTIIDSKLAEIISATKAWELIFWCTPEEIKEQKSEIQADRTIASEQWNPFLPQIWDLVEREWSV